MKKYKELESSDGVDVLRSLPKNVLEDILTRLPIKDAVRTSILSRSWRYEWNTLPNIIFDLRSFPFDDEDDQIEFDRKMVKIVDQVLLLHQGPIHTFVFSVEIGRCVDMNRWILYLSRLGIRSFTLNIWMGEDYTLPSCLFSCADITYLGLYGCIFVPPVSFGGFNHLAEMDLQCVDFAEHGLTVLMSQLSHLKKLTFKNNRGFTHLKLCARELEHLELEGHFEDVHFESTPLLADVSLNTRSITSKTTCRILKVLGSLSSINKLELHERTLQNLAVGDIPECIGASFPVKHLIVDINFEYMQQMLAALCILRSSLLLQKLDIKVITKKYGAGLSSEGFWAGGEDLCCTFNHLKDVKVNNFTGTPSEVKFVRFVLANSPVLKSLQIVFMKSVDNMLNIFKELIRFPRISPKAEIIMP